MGVTRFDVLAARTGLSEGDFVRVTRRAPGVGASQSILDLWRGKTCVVQRVDWEEGQVELAIVPAYKNTGHYVLPSHHFKPDREDPRERRPYACATLDASITDFVAGEVERRLEARPGATLPGRHAVRWMDPVRPTVPPQSPLPPARRQALEGLLADLRFGDDLRLEPRRIRILLEGLETRMQLIQGPPGTGKTQVTAFAILARILARHGPGDVLLVAAHTHTAVDTLLDRLLSLREGFVAQARAAGLSMASPAVAKVDRDWATEREGALEHLKFGACYQRVQQLSKDRPLVIGGTVRSVLRMIREGLNGKNAYKGLPDGFQAPLLVVDEASMMVSSHFLSLVTAVRPDGAVLLAGDHRQLSPIVAHDWETEDRPPSVLYKPFVSAYEAVLRLSGHRAVGPAQVAIHRLEKTYRLPPVIRELIRPLYEQDGIALVGPERDEERPANPATTDPWELVWRCGHRLVLALHDERRSEQSNPTEAAILDRILAAGGDLGEGSVAVVTPHRAQRALLRGALAAYAGPVDVIDTVERLQGGERPFILFSATVSDPVVISQTVEFILDLNRSNVAFSRTQELLVVVCARSLLDHIPVEVEHYESAMLWKHLRTLCSKPLARAELGDTEVTLMVPAATSLS